MRLSILNAGYRSTNYWVVSRGRARLLVDLGWRLKEVETALARVVAAGWSDDGGALDDLVRRTLAQLMDR